MDNKKLKKIESIRSSIIGSNATCTKVLCSLVKEHSVEGVSIAMGVTLGSVVAGMTKKHHSDMFKIKLHIATTVLNELKGE